ncbi:3'-5' DNA helicase [Starmerella bacillaris]|uniref:ATP-dependent DNA helicase n=1 Tax=Starmerella bacillaris TaxID=1247836 RepID=A0AAV5RGY2_STABA|nr:3'-5' DNA helicase [Starmerella bacillaris]
MDLKDRNYQPPNSLCDDPPFLFTSDEDDFALSAQRAEEERLLAENLSSDQPIHENIDSFDPPIMFSSDDIIDTGISRQAEIATPRTSEAGNTARSQSSSVGSTFYENSLTLRCQSKDKNTEACRHELVPEALDTYLYPINMEIRDYQRNIIKKALTRNLICALPTGLGKTFIASVVMLNWFRWTKEAKIIFIAPTRPLVAQQVKSFLEISGISIKHTAVLLQSVVNRSDRSQVWADKRVFFATAQTIENDLRNGHVDPKSIVLMVFDEAHKATGNHSYVNVVKMMREVTSDFRILALTATPSGKLDGVQTVIDNLLIAGTEIRSEESIDIRKYVHSREIEKILVDYTPEQQEFIKLANESVQDFFPTLKQASILYSSDVSSIHPFVIQQGIKRYMAGPAARFNNGRKFQIQALAALVGKVVYALQMLKTHGIMPFYQRMHALELEVNGSKGKNAAQLKLNKSFKSILRMCREKIYGEDKGMTYSYTSEERKLGFLSHPKLDLLRHKVDRFFLNHGSDSRVIIFADFRDSAAEIKWILSTFNSERVRATLFVGQATNKKTANNVKGMTQKEQQSILTKFKSGAYNVLVATSIGEEGLDIGQVDLIICYDQSQSPIRNIQRMGRTGRKRDGNIIMLMTKEEANKLSMAFDGHKYIREQIIDNSHISAQTGLLDSRSANNPKFKFTYHPANRMLPSDTEPTYKEVVIQTPAENKEALASNDILSFMKLKPSFKRKSSAEPKRAKLQKQLDDIDLEDLGFRNANDVFAKQLETHHDVVNIHKD